MLLACQGQVRLAPNGQVIGIDMDAALQVATARGCAIRSSAGCQSCSGCIALAVPISGYEIVEDLFGDMNVRFTA
jgi:hypothetical protein